MWADIHSKIMTANRAYVTHTKFFGSGALSRNTKLKLRKIFIRPLRTYGSEAWKKPTDETNAIRIFERKMIMKTYRRFICLYVGTHKEIRDILKAADTVKSIKSVRLRRRDRVERMQNQRMPKQIASGTVEGTRKRKRPRKRWRDEVEEGLNVMIKKGQAMVRDRSEWRKSVLEATVPKGPWCLRIIIIIIIIRAQYGIIKILHQVARMFNTGIYAVNNVV